MPKTKKDEIEKLQAKRERTEARLRELKNEEKILAGEFEGSLIKHISEIPRQAYQKCEETAYSKIYHCKDVVDIDSHIPRIEP